MIKRAVSIGAHNLDAELMGGTLLMKYAKKGTKVTYINATMGRLEHGTDKQKEEYLKKVKAQAKKAAKDLGGDTLWLGYVGSNMPSLDEFANAVKEYLKKEKVELVITHWRGSMHPRHINTHDAVTKAVKDLRKEGYKIKLLYGETFEDEVGFIPQAYYVLEDKEVKQWLKGLNEYEVFKGTVNGFPYNAYYTTNLTVRGIESGSNKPTVCYMYPSLIEEIK